MRTEQFSAINAKELELEMRKYIFPLVIGSVVVPLLFLRSVGGQVAGNAGWRETAMHMRLTDDLDRPQDGWCLDVVGSGPHIRFDMPLIAHNCKAGLFADEAVEFTELGQIRFPAYPGYCVTVMGLNQHALPGAALMLKGCGEEIPFLNAPKFQTFELLDNGMIRLKGSNLCITVGDESKETFDPTHAWRTLYMERCDDCEPARSTWKFVRP